MVWETPDASAPYGVLTGDTLFIGDVGRPDLVAAQGRSPEEMAAELYRSLHARVLTLPDATRVYPHQLADIEPPEPLALEEVLRRQADGAVVLDVRSPEEFARGHLRGSVNVGLDGRFAEYAAQVASGDIVLVCDPGRGRDARLRLARVGLDSVTGALDDPVPAFIGHPEVTRTASRLTPVS